MDQEAATGLLKPGVVFSCSEHQGSLVSSALSLPLCLSYFSIAVKKQHAKATWRGLQSRGLGVHDHHDEEHGSRQAGMVLGQQLRAHISVCKQKAESANWKCRETFEVSKPTRDTSPASQHLLVISKQFYHLGTKYSDMSLQGHSHSKATLSKPGLSSTWLKQAVESRLIVQMLLTWFHPVSVSMPPTVTMIREPVCHPGE